MNTLLAIELGPVNAFVAAARKTRDFWAGSWMMSELAKAAARGVVEACGGGHEVLIFPAPLSSDDLKADSDLVVADVILAELPVGVSPAQAALQAKTAAHQHWTHLAKEAKKGCKFDGFREEVWDLQTAELNPVTAGEVIECYAAWVKCSGDYKKNEGTYTTDRQRLMRLLSGRTNCRNFPVLKGKAGVPKSSLDGARESVLPEPTERGEEESIPTDVRRGELRVSAGEQLDAFGVTKRTTGGKRQYPSTSRIAADAWLRGAKARCPTEYTAFTETCKLLADKQFLTKVGEGRYPQYKSFPYEGAAVYETRHSELFEEATGKLASQKRAAGQQSRDKDLENLKAALAAVVKKHGEPDPHYAIFSADGDRVGEALGRLTSPEEHREFSQKLAAFAGQVHEIVGKEPPDGFNGVSVYVGGDDVIVLLPVDRAVECCEQIAATFKKQLENYGDSITLSGGLVIAHHSDALEDVLAWAEESKNAAKDGGRNSIVVRLQPRGGAPISVLKSWNDRVSNSLEKWVELLASDRLPGKVAYDLRRLAEFYLAAEKENAFGSPEALAEVLRVDTLRLLTRKTKDVLTIVRPFVSGLKSPQELVDLANWIIVARRVERCRAQAGVTQ